MPEIKVKNPHLFSRIENLRLSDKYFVLIRGVRVVREEYMSDKMRNDFIKKYGSAQGYKKYSLQECQNIARKYKSRMEFKEKDTSMYDFSHRNYDMDEVCKHMIKKSPHNRTDKGIQVKSPQHGLSAKSFIVKPRQRDFTFISTHPQRFFLSLAGMSNSPYLCCQNHELDDGRSRSCRSHVDLISKSIRSHIEL